MMIKLSVVAVALLALAEASVSTYTPTRISYDELLEPTPDSSQRFLQALRDVGMVSITNVPSLYKIETLKALVHCVEASPPSSAQHMFPDGTLRETIATHSVAGHMEPLGIIKEACRDLVLTSPLFREKVTQVTHLLATQLATVLNLEGATLVSSVDPQRDYTLIDVVDQGEHLEHFHSYTASAHNNIDLATIDWHTDQGLSLIFTPGLMDASHASSGFYIQLPDGSTPMVDFSLKDDDLVLLLGDGVNQYMPNTKLRALPHAFVMPQDQDKSKRVWYGRMVLPPSDAVHPVHHQTFGDLRETMISSEASSFGLGCSSTLYARQLEEASCEQDTFHCWHRCYNYTDDASPEACEAQDLDLACVNDKGELWIGDHNPDFAPGCVDLATAKNFTPPMNSTDHSEHSDGDKNHTDSDHSGDLHSDGSEHTEEDDHSDHDHSQ